MTEKKKVGLAIAGCGFGASALYGSYFRYLENGELIAVVDKDKTRTANFQKLSGAKKAYSDFDEMLKDPEIDAVMIVTPPFVHLEQVLKAAEAGKHVYCEKPMAKTLKEAREMIDVCNKNRVKLQVAFMKRFNRSYRLVKGIIEDGKIGEVFEMRAIWDNARAATGRDKDYRHNSMSGGGFLQEDGSHPIDVIRWWMGDVDEVSANVMVVDPDRYDNDSVAAVMMKHKNGSMSTLHITMLTHRTGGESYEVFGTKGTLLVKWPYHSTHTLEPAVIEVHRGSNMVEDYTLSTSWSPQEELESNWQYLNEMRSFCECILNDRQPEVTGEDGMAAVEIINAAYISSDERRNVALPLEKIPNFDEIFGKLRNASKWKIPDSEAWWSHRY